MTSQKYLEFVGKLDNVRSAKPRAGVHASHRALCPVCDKHGHSRKLSVALSTTGVILIECFAMCQKTDIVAAVGMSLADLFPNTKTHHSPPAFRNVGEWMSVAALADAVSWAAALAANEPTQENLAALVAWADSLQMAAGRAFRKGDRK